jgi:branched-subunit amino acid aminotransferase/4-amino-4-deoxychorismate lyase
MTKTIYSYANGEYLLTDKVSINVSQDMLGTFRGYRIFTACRTLNNGNVFHLDDHIERLFYSAKIINMQLPHNPTALKEIILRLVKKNVAAGDILLQIMYSGGAPTSGTLVPKGPAHLYILAFPLTIPSDKWYQNGITLASFVYQRQWPEVKLLSYVGGVVASQTVVKNYKADDALFVSPLDNQTILEGTTFSIFCVNEDDHLLTPPLDGRILDGITRKILIDLAQSNNLQLSETTITLNMLAEMKELFFVSSTKNIVPIIRVDRQLIGNGKPGQLTNYMGKLLNSYQKSYADN